jgi:hypothetical protein
VIDEGYFMALGGIGVTLAGFAGLISAFDRGAGSHSPQGAWRLRNIVVGGFVVTLVGFGTLAVFTITGGDYGLTVRLAAAGLAASGARSLLLEEHGGPAWPSARGRRVAMAIVGALILADLTNVALGSLGYLKLLLLLHLSAPMSIFLNTVREVAAERYDAGQPVASGGQSKATHGG